MTNQNQTRNTQGEFANKQDPRNSTERDRAGKERTDDQKKSGKMSESYKPTSGTR